MRNLSSNSKMMWQALVLVAVAAVVGACHRGASKDDVVQAANIPPSFDVTLVAAKDNQFDYNDTPLTSEDLTSALRYRMEQKLPTATVILTRGEKEKIKKEQIIALARIAYQMKIRAFIRMQKDGEISELRAQPKESDDSNESDEPKAPRRHQKSDSNEGLDKSR